MGDGGGADDRLAQRMLTGPLKAGGEPQQLAFLPRRQGTQGRHRRAALGQVARAPGDAAAVGVPIDLVVLAEDVEGAGLDPFQPPGAFADSPSGSYAPNANATLTLAEPLDLTGVAGAKLEFSARWDIEATWDFLTVEASTNGTSWAPLAGTRTTAASGSGAQVPAGAPGYEGQQPIWTRESISLAAYDGAPSLRLRFRLRADGFDQRDGAYVDDVAVTRLVNGGTVSTADAPAAVASSLGAPSPNPTRAGVRLDVVVGRAGDVDLAVFDVLGRPVRTLADGPAPAGVREVVWDGRDASGAPAPAGVYVLRLVAPDAVVTRRVIVAR